LAKKPKTNRKKSNKNAFLVVGAAVVMAGVIWAAVNMSSTNQSGLPSTLDPMQFLGKIRNAYQAAKDVPEVLAEMPCFCGCMQNNGHENNLFCFRDDHGVHCDMCQSIAIEARDLYRQGKTVESIRAEITRRYSPYAP
jgi:hypothetical protein